jgi:hypothetical protein
VLTAPTLAQLRALIPIGRVCLARNAGDDPCIVECWV